LSRHALSGRRRVEREEVVDFAAVELFRFRQRFGEDVAAAPEDAVAGKLVGYALHSYGREEFHDASV